jgi:hypothetical protein
VNVRRKSVFFLKKKFYSRDFSFIFNLIYHSVKKLICFFLLVFPAVCFSQTEVNLTIYHKLGATDFGYYFPSQNNTPNGNFKLTRMEYYLSNFSLIYDGGQTLSIADTIVALVKAGQPTTISLGSFTVSNIEGIKFFVGVPKNYNHKDPALQANGSALAYQAPSMHWGWISGYQFIALEGLTSPTMNELTELHSFGDDNYYETSVFSPGTLYNGAYYININANYNRALENIDISTGLIVHGDFLQANTLIENFNNYVFSSSNSLAELIEKSVSDISIYPIPSHGKFIIRTPLIFSGDLVKIFTLDGQYLAEYQLKAGINELIVEVDHSGTLILEFFDKNNRLFSKTIVNL